MAHPNDVAAIEQLLVRYATGIDTRDWDLFRTCFMPDAICDYGDYGSWTDLEGVADYMERAHLGFASTNHLLTNFVIDVDDDRATASCYVHVVLALADPGSWIDGIGRYDDELVRTTDGWRIATRSFHRTRLLTSVDLGGAHRSAEAR